MAGLTPIGDRSGHLLGDPKRCSGAARLDRWTTAVQEARTRGDLTMQGPIGSWILEVSPGLGAKRPTALAMPLPICEALGKGYSLKVILDDKDQLATAEGTLIFPI